MFVQGIGGDAMYKTAFAILKNACGTLDVIRERRNRVSHIKSICLQIYDFIFYLQITNSKKVVKEKKRKVDMNTF